LSLIFGKSACSRIGAHFSCKFSDKNILFFL
jgi:hypothetical protein